MGIIEETIFANYKKALSEGNLDQAKKAVELAQILRTKIETEGFIDIDHLLSTDQASISSFFEPFPYRYDPFQAVVVFENSAISLTRLENKLFALLSENETRADNIKIISKEDLKNSLWGARVIGQTALKTLIKRIRQKIEPNPKKASIIINYYAKGYIFLGKRKFDSE